MIRLYFGRLDDPRPVKDEVAAFITEDMGLVRGEGKPRWSERIGELIDFGMKAWYCSNKIDIIVRSSILNCHASVSMSPVLGACICVASRSFSRLSRSSFSLLSWFAARRVTPVLMDLNWKLRFGVTT